MSTLSALRQDKMTQPDLFVPVDGYNEVEVSECGSWARSRLEPSDVVDLRKVHGRWVRLRLDPSSRRSRLVRVDMIVPRLGSDADADADADANGGCGSGGGDSGDVDDVDDVHAVDQDRMDRRGRACGGMGRTILRIVSAALVALAIAAQVQYTDRGRQWGSVVSGSLGSALGRVSGSFGNAVGNAVSDFALAMAPRARKLGSWLWGGAECGDHVWQCDM